MEIIIKNGIRFNNVPTYPATGFTTLLTNIDNVTNNKYKYDNDSDPIISALDINWCGAEIEPGVTINTTDELINWIKNNSISNSQKQILEECKNILNAIKYVMLQNSENIKLYWYAGAGPINSSTIPGIGSGWTEITDNNPTSIATGEKTNATAINWILAVPTSLGLNHISNGVLDVTTAYDESIVTCADGVEYKVFTQIATSKRTDRIFIP